MNSKLKGFSTHYAICQKFGQTRRCVIHVKSGQVVCNGYLESHLVWIERPEDEYGIDRAIAADPWLAVLYRDDWMRGEVIPDEKHRTKQFQVGDKVKVLRQIYDVVPVGAVVTIKEIRDHNPDNNINTSQPRDFPPYLMYLFDYQGRECAATYDRFELVEGVKPAPLRNHLFSESDEREFKRQFAIQWLAAIEAVNYQNNCHHGWNGRKPPVEDAQCLANMAWDEWKETIGVNQ